MRLAIVTSHPIQYQAPLFRELARRSDLKVFFAHRADENDQAAGGFGVRFSWDVDLTSGYQNEFLENRARRPSLNTFDGCDTPGVGAALAEFRPDVLMLTGWRLRSDWQALMGAKRLGKPVMVRGDSQLDTPRGALKRLAKDLVYPPLLRAFDVALYVGERSRRYWAHYKYPAERMFSSPHCVDTEWFAARATAEAGQALRRRAGIADDAFVVAFAGKLAPYKRPLDAVAAAAEARKRIANLVLLVAGSGELQDDVAALARELDLPTHMLGFQNQSEMPAVYAAANALILPSGAEETWGLVANEALACGAPIVVSRACGCALDLADGVVGLSAPVGDVQGLAATLEQLSACPPPAAALQAKSRAYGIAAAADGVLAAAQALTAAG